MKKKSSAQQNLMSAQRNLMSAQRNPICALDPPPDLPEGRKYTVGTVPFVYFFCEKSCGNVWWSHGFFVPL